MNERSEFYPRLKVDAASRSTVSQAGALLLLETVRATGLHRAPMARSWAGEPGWLPWGQLHDACPTGPDNQTPSRSPGRVRDGAGRAAQGLARVSGLERTPSGWPGTQLAVQAVTAGNDEVNTEPPDVHTYLRSRRSCGAAHTRFRTDLRDSRMRGTRGRTPQRRVSRDTTSVLWN